MPSVSEERSFPSLYHDTPLGILLEYWQTKLASLSYPMVSCLGDRDTVGIAN